MRGRKPQPTVLRLVKGNPGKRPINEREPRPEVAAPSPPGHLTPAARIYWDDLVPRLLRTRILTELDGDVVALYCQAKARYVAAEAQLAANGAIIKHPSGGFGHSPFMTILNTSLQQMERLGDRLGLSPSARVRLAVDGHAPPKSEFFDD